MFTDKIREYLACILSLFAGVGILIAGTWLIWDLTTTIVVQYVQGGKPWDTFTFPFPLFVATSQNWTLPFDIGLGFQMIGVFLIIMGAFLLGTRITERRRKWTGNA